MRGEKGKAPAVQWYYKDWLSDRQLQRASAATRGIWMNLLMHMVDCSLDGQDCKEGVLEDMTISELSQLGSCSESEAWQFIEDAAKHKFCNIEMDKNGTFHIMSRRLSRDADKRAKWREQKQKQREKEPEEKTCPQNVQDPSTPCPPLSPIPTPIPTPTSKNKTTKKHMDFPDWLDKDLWKDFREFRNRKKAPLTERASELIFSKLEKLKESGSDPNDVIRQSIERGWSGVFPIKPEDAEFQPGGKKPWHI